MAPALAPVKPGQAKVEKAAPTTTALFPVGKCSGVVIKTQGPADEVRLTVLSPNGLSMGETVKLTNDNMVILDFPGAAKGLGFMVAKGYLKGALQWESRLGRFQF